MSDTGEEMQALQNAIEVLTESALETAAMNHVLLDASSILLARLLVNDPAPYGDAEKFVRQLRASIASRDSVQPPDMQHVAGYLNSAIEAISSATTRHMDALGYRPSGTKIK